MQPDDPPQLDLFADSRDVMLRNDAIEALLRHDTEAACRARDALAQFDAHDSALPLLATLIGAPARAAPGLPGPWANHEEAAAEQRWLADTVGPAAAELLRDAAARWMAVLWCAMAERCAGLRYRADHAAMHAARCWLLADEPASAARAVLTIESWRRIPAPLDWMLQARHATEGLDAVWPLLAELAWLSPRRLASSLQALHDPLINRLQRRFEAEFEPDAGSDGEALAWFPAWVLNDQPALLSSLRLAEPGLGTLPESAFRLICELLGLERQGRHAALMEGRKRLRGLAPALFAVYMTTR